MKLNARANKEMRKEQIGKIIRELIYQVKDWKPEDVSYNICTTIFDEVNTDEKVLKGVER